MAPTLPRIIVGGDPFNRFSYLYGKKTAKLKNKNFALNVLREAYIQGATAFDLSFESNVSLFRDLAKSLGAVKIIGIGNPTYKQGVCLNGEYLHDCRNRIIKTLISSFFPKNILSLIKNNPYLQKYIFYYDKSASKLSDKEIKSIYLDYSLFKKRLALFKKDCQFLMLGGDDADWLFSLGRSDIVQEMYDIAIAEGFKPIFLSQYSSYIIPKWQLMKNPIWGYAISINKLWSCFDINDCISTIRSLKEPVIAFRPLSFGDLSNDIEGAIRFLYRDVPVYSLMVGLTSVADARETINICNKIIQNISK